MSIRGKWRIVEMPGYESDFPDMMICNSEPLSSPAIAGFAADCFSYRFDFVPDPAGCAAAALVRRTPG